MIPLFAAPLCGQVYPYSERNLLQDTVVISASLGV